MIHAVWLLVLLAWLAIARLTRLITDDAVLDAPRNWARDRGGHLGYFVTCPWCVSIWLGAGVAAVTYRWPHAWPVQVGLLALSGSFITGLLATLITLAEESM